LTGVPRFADGIVAHAFHDALVRAFPDAALTDCTQLLDDARYIKSAEEIAFLRGSVALAEAAIAAMRDTARPGASENKVYAAMIAAMIERGSEIPAMIMWSAGPPGQLVSAGPPVPRRFAAGDFLRIEVEGRYAGYCGQVTQMAVLGKLPQAYRDMWKVQQEAVALCCAAARPGVTLGALAQRTEAVARGTPCQIKFLMHGRGLGDDSPMYVFSAPDAVKNWPLAENASFIIKPVVTREGHADVVWGDSVVINEAGARRLGSLPPEIFELA
jgi:Xaa-Pro aminopeptidase